MTDVDLSVIVPVYNERARLEAGLRAILAWQDQTARCTELIVVDDGSLDGGAELAASLLAGRARARLIRLPANRGKGGAVRAGMLAASGRVRLFTDIDLSVPIAAAQDFYAACAASADLAIGTRRTAASRIAQRQPRRRELLGAAFRRIALRLFAPGLTDVTCGFKAFRAETAERLFAAAIIDRWAFDAELLFLASRWRLRIQEIPVEWRNDPQSKVRLWVDLPRSGMEMLRILMRWLRGGYRGS